MSSVAPCPVCNLPVKWWSVGTSLTNEHRGPAGEARCAAGVTVLKPAPVVTPFGPATALMSCRVPGRPPNLANSRLHPMQLYRVKNDRMNTVVMVALSARAVARLEPCIEPRLLAAIVHYRGRRPDMDNAVTNVKADIDGLVKAGWLRADDPAWMPKAPIVDSKRLEKYQNREWTEWMVYTVDA